MSKKSKRGFNTTLEYDYAEWDADILEGHHEQQERSNSVDLLQELRRSNRVHAPTQMAMARFSEHYAGDVHIMTMPNNAPNPTFARSFRYGKEANKHGCHDWKSKSGTQTASRGSQCDIKPSQRTTVVQCQPHMREMTIQTHGGANTDAVVVRTRSRDQGVQASTNEAVDYQELLTLVRGLHGRAPIAPVSPQLPDGLLQEMARSLAELRAILQCVNDTAMQVDAKENEILSAMQLLKLVGGGGNGKDVPEEALVRIANLLEGILSAVKTCATADDASKLFELIAELNKTTIELKVDCQEIIKVLSNIVKSIGFEEEYFVKIIAYLQEMLRLLCPEEVQEVVTGRQLYEGRCRCAEIGDVSTAIYRGSRTKPMLPSLCQRCINNFKGRTFVQSLNLPMPFTEDIVNVLGKSIECIERDDEFNLELQLNECKQKVGNKWDMKAYAIAYEALLHIALLWGSKQTTVYLAGRVKISMMVKGIKNEEHRYRLPDYIYKAIKSRNLEVIERIFEDMNDNEAVMVINTPLLMDKVKKYPLFEAARIGDLEMFNFFVMHGAAFDVKEGDRMILHELAWISKQKLQSPKLKEWNQVIVSMFGVIYDRAGHWWERHLLHAAWTGSTEASRINALNYLCSIQDSHGLNAIQFAARHATPEVIRKIVCNPPYEFIPDPIEFGHENGLKGYVVDQIESHLACKDRSVLERMLLRDPIDGACVMSIEPFKSMIDDKWHHYRIFYGIWFIIYLIYILVYSACAVNRPIGFTTLLDMYQTRDDYARLIGEILIIVFLPLFFYGEIRDGIRMGFVAPRPWLRTGMFRILNLLFVIFTIVVIFLRAFANPNEEIPLALSLILGWLLALEFLGAWKCIGMFAIIMHRVITFDIALKFLLVWMISLAGTSTATFVAYQQSATQIDVNFPNNSFWFTPFSLSKVSFALLDGDYATEAFNPPLGVILWIIFIFLFNFTLFSLLIGMMADTYARTRIKTNQSWIWVKANYALLMDRRLPHFLCIKYSENKQSGFARNAPTKLRYLTRPQKRRVREGNVVEITEHVVLVASADQPHAVEVKPQDIDILASKLISTPRD